MKVSIFCAFILILPALSLAADPQQTVIIVPVADVWSAPSNDPAALTDDKRETQVLFGEKVLIHESSGAWVRIEAVEQPTFRQHNRWEGYSGWISRQQVRRSNYRANATMSDLWVTLLGDGHYKLEIPFGSRLYLWPPSTDKTMLVAENSIAHGMTSGNLYIPSKTASRTFSMWQAAYHIEMAQHGIIESARLFLNTPYLWGGLSPQGIDCSGLIHVLYRSIRKQIPRDSYEQWMKAKPIKRADLTSGDLIFSAKVDNPKKITHVALYVGDGQIIEAPQTGMVVRKISFEEKYGKPLGEVESGDTVGKRVIYFGSFLLMDKSRS